MQDYPCTNLNKLAMKSDYNSIKEFCEMDYEFYCSGNKKQFVESMGSELCDLCG